MPLTIPPAVNYQTPLVSLPVVWSQSPVEGDRIVPVEITWATMGGAFNCVSINIYGGAAQTISQIVALSVDNSDCASDITFLFPDTQQSYGVKAQTPVATFPVFSNQTQFFVSAPAAGPSDVTRFGVLNSMPPPVALPETVPPTQTASAANLRADITTAQQIIAAGVNGTLTGYTISFAFASAPAGTVAYEFKDGTGAVLFAAGATASGLAVNVQGVALRFVNGVTFNVIGPTLGAAGSLAIVNAYYTVP
jgi:hypothetical protein